MGPKYSNFFLSSWRQTLTPDREFNSLSNAPHMGRFEAMQKVEKAVTSFWTRPNGTFSEEPKTTKTDATCQIQATWYTAVLIDAICWAVSRKSLSFSLSTFVHDGHSRPCQEYVRSQSCVTQLLDACTRSWSLSRSSNASSLSSLNKPRGLLAPA